ncbi:type II toxin-antitoxin system Phd/YefM family antitoxin [Vibrio splendidus]|uniref:type II toxin-antitoxin system Phd/YefM family antitoxin n=1 Tax=Vibrio splendidus TaxID=29497 RepID=UPI000066E8FB|nr:type II toxin-antitoxin system prevent-host-death family antitoxin [Vibrio splendidus]EAP95250.1 putative YefM protein [Vibrio splendidus 12B01]
MNIVSFTEARNSLKSVLDRVVDDSDVTVITRRDSEDAVVMSLDHFNSMQETLYLMSSPKNAERLAESIAQLEAGNTTVRELNNGE